MGDEYSLMLRNRLAVEGEELIAHRFRNGIIGMVSRADFCRWQSANEAELEQESPSLVVPTSGLWQSVKNFFIEFLTFYGFMNLAAQSLEGEPGPVVAIPSEALLRVFGISQDVQRQYHLGPFEDALFTEISRSGLRQDALCFGNGATIPLQLLREGQRVKVLRRSWAESLDPDPEPIRMKA